MNDNRWIEGQNLYVQIWRKALTAFGWPADRLEWFVAQYAKDIQDDNSLFYHEDPAHYLTLELLSESANEEIAKRLGSQSSGWPWELYHPVHEMLNTALDFYNHTFKSELPNMPDWAKLKSEIQIFLAQHGEKLRFGNNSS
jgi:hypothetical protein